MKRQHFIALITALGLAGASLAPAPASAGDNDAAKILAGIVGVAVLGAILNEAQKDSGKVTTHIQRSHQPVTRHKHYHIQPKPLPKQVQRHYQPRKVLPQRCLRVRETPRGTVRYFGQRCLAQTYPRAHRLPQQCARSFQTYRGWRNGYAARCLRRAGYTMARY